ncbi:hypothetical protein AVEN_54173-1, partial [Araneus ventricosus]
MGSQSRRPTSVPLLTALHKALLLSWARQHYHWTVDDWKHVTWSNQSHFQLYRADARVRILKRIGSMVSENLYPLTPTKPLTVTVKNWNFKTDPESPYVKMLPDDLA